MPSAMVRESVFAVMNTTGMLRVSALVRSARTRLSPSSSGIMMSMSRSCGLGEARSICISASSPCSASATRYPALLKVALSSARSDGSSSTTRICAASAKRRGLVDEEVRDVVDDRVDQTARGALERALVVPQRQLALALRARDDLDQLL